MGSQNTEDFLAHHGVKGMKWGKHLGLNNPYSPMTIDTTDDKFPTRGRVVPNGVTTKAAKKLIDSGIKPGDIDNRRYDARFYGLARPIRSKRQAAAARSIAKTLDKSGTIKASTLTKNGRAFQDLSTRKQYSPGGLLENPILAKAAKRRQILNYAEQNSGKIAKKVGIGGLFVAGVIGSGVIAYKVADHYQSKQE